MKLISMGVLLSILWIGCSLSPPAAPEMYNWKGELQVYYDSLETAREVQRADQESEGIYSTLLLMNVTERGVIIRAEIVDGGYGSKDLLLGRDLGPGQYVVRIFTGDLPRTVKLLWKEGTVTFHGIPLDGRLVIGEAETGYQEMNVYVVED